MSRPKSGTVYEWDGLPGQASTDRLIRVDSLTAACTVNAAILADPYEDPVALVTIGLADLEAAIRLGYLREIPNL